MKIKDFEPEILQTGPQRAWQLVARSMALALLCAGCGPTGVTLLKPSDLVNYQYVTCYPHQNDPGVLEECIRHYEKQGFVREDQINVLQM